MQQEARRPVYGPTFDEMLHPDRMPADVRQRALDARLRGDELDPVNLFNITWKAPQGKVYALVVPRALTGVDANIVVLFSRDFPTGSHKVGATYSVAMEHQLNGEIVPGLHTVVWPSTGNYGIGGAWVSGRMGYDGLVLLPEEMSAERFRKIEYYGCRYIKTPGCESNVKEIYDKTHELAREPNTRIANQFAEFANYRFHWHVTGNSAAEALAALAAEGVGNGRAAAFTSSMGSAGTIAAGDRLKQLFYECRIVGLEPTQCPTLYSNGYGGHDIQGIGDKHVTWIHNVMNMDAIMCIDDMECKQGLQLLTDPAGLEYLVEKAGVPADAAVALSKVVGISGVCNILGAIKAAKLYRFGAGETVVTVCTDTMDRYHSVMGQLDQRYGKMDATKAAVRLEHIFHGQKTDWISEGTVHNRDRWFNLKYYTWVEQQGKTVQQLNAQRSQDYWLAEQAKVPEVDALLREARGF
jgi:cysteine synthase